MSMPSTTTSISAPIWVDFGRMLDFLGPAQVGDVDEAVDAVRYLYEDAEIGEVAHLGGVARATG